MLARITAFALWGAVAVTAVFFGARLAFSASPVSAQTVQALASAPPRTDLTRLLGAGRPTAAAPQRPSASDSRYRLAGIMAPRRASHSSKSAAGVALIAVDGAPPRAFRVGQAVPPDLVLREVGLRTVTVAARGGDRLVLEMPPLPPPATGEPQRAAEADAAVAPGVPTEAPAQAAASSAPAAAAPANDRAAQMAARRAAARERMLARRARLGLQPPASGAPTPSEQPPTP